MRYIDLKKKLQKLNEEQIQKPVLIEDEYEDYFPARWDQQRNLLVVKQNQEFSFTFSDLLQFLGYMNESELQKKVKYMTLEDNIYEAYFSLADDKEETTLEEDTPYLSWH